MQNHNKQDSLKVNKIDSDNTVTAMSNKTVGTADNSPFCLYNHKRHAAGSKLVNEDGSESVCSTDGSWKNQKS